MVTARLVDEKWISVGGTPAEVQQVELAFTKKIDSWYIIKSKNPDAIVDEKFMTNYGIIPVGLWLELINTCQSYGYNVVFLDDFNERIKDTTISKDTFVSYIDRLFQYNTKLKPRDYQYDGVYNLITYKKCCMEVSTSGGKTIMAYMFFRFLKDFCHYRHVLFITPKTNLTTQSADDFIEYDQDCQMLTDWTFSEIHAKSKKQDTYDENIVFGNYHSLCRKKQDFFDKFDAVIVDECLHPYTMIHMADNTYRCIKDVRPGDFVYTYNESTCLKEVHEVDTVYKNLSKHDYIYEISLENYNLIRITGNHKVLLNTGNWTRVDELKRGDVIMSFYGMGKLNAVNEIKKITYTGDVYNLRIKSDDEHLNHNYFAEDLCVSNCHHTQSKSIRHIIKNCRNAKYIVGMTGTFPEDGSYKSFTIQSYIGPVVFRLPSYELINEKKSATPVHINMIEMKYLEPDKLQALYDIRAVSKKDDPTMGNKILATEREIARNSGIRLSYICNIIGKTTKNSLVIFSDVQNDYGRNVYNRIRETTDKVCYYIDGGTAPKTREQMTESMEQDLTGNTVIIASIGCFSEGINIKNVWNIFLIETTKSDNTLAQILGRGMRQFDGKEKTMMIDFVDDFCYGTGFYSENYLYKHGKARHEIYTKRGFPCNVISVDLLSNK